VRDEVEEPVRGFIREYVGSVTELEVLLLLLADRTRGWTAADVARELRISVEFSRNHLAKLSADGILREVAATPGAYQYGVSTPQLSETVTRLAQLYARNRATIIDLIYSTPNDRIRTFADAFKIRKDK
jgi:predicted DNA-binding transcriptional regulator